MLKASIQLQRPDDVEVTLTMTMPLRDWIALQQQLGSNRYPSWAFSAAINQLVSQAKAEFTVTHEVKTP